MKKFVSVNASPPYTPTENSHYVFATLSELLKLSGGQSRVIYNDTPAGREYSKYITFMSVDDPHLPLIHLFSYGNVDDVGHDELCKWYISVQGSWSFKCMWTFKIIRRFTEWLMVSLTQPEVVETQDVSIDVKKLDEEINRLFAMTTSDCKTVNTLYDIVQPVAESFKKLQGLVEYHSLLKSAENVKNAALSSKVGYDEEPDEYVREEV